MKSLKLLFFAIVSAVGMSQSLAATPIYVSVWENGETGRRVILYGDFHYSLNLALGDKGLKPDQEQVMAKKFIQNLKNLPEDSDETLFLVEDWGMHSEELSKMRTLCLEDSIFFSQLHLQRSAILSSIPTESIDFRHNWLLANLHFNLTGSVFDREETLKPLSDRPRYQRAIRKQMVVFGEGSIENTLHVLGDYSMAYLIGEHLERIEDLIAKTSNPTLQSILKEIKADEVEYKQQLIDQLLELGFSWDKLGKLSMNDVFKKFKQFLQIKKEGGSSLALDKYGALYRFFIKASDASVMLGSKELDARVLSRIVHSSSTIKKIVVVAGDLHIKNIEKYLGRLGYRELRGDGCHFNSWYLFLGVKQVPYCTIDWMLDPVVRRSERKRKLRDMPEDFN